ncbi:inositol hexakisphosphate and diphosphoinositol-pentakisphosphate kinase [Brettanomyces nanus]|uniref:Inositol hexakisphosphate and diphosphoinositol-pentakisphosphate kinase n=1 Tax=Eeniella nana TaxID=13502 RepID=A0A875S5B5_EENNA|nr:inositol hexakisphosphate and diphosphoinositol-pentakisphosphate kinase [Brettanomyces nanus]QPG76113.1 inositol hexakisphosphate and diphosphoinositol-pentakisphosphate kinase [Brettanomyces nanus]
MSSADKDTRSQSSQEYTGRQAIPITGTSGAASRKQSSRAMSTNSASSIDSLRERTAMISVDENMEDTGDPLTIDSLEQHRKAAASIAPILEGFSPVLSKSEVVSPAQNPLSRTASNISSLSISHTRSGTSAIPQMITTGTTGAHTAVAEASHLMDTSTSPLTSSPSSVEGGSNSGSFINVQQQSEAKFGKKSRSFSASLPEHRFPRKQKVGTIGVCAMDNKVLSKPCRQILNRLINHGEFDTVIFGDKVILDESIENWPTCDFLISFFSTGFPLEKAIAYAKLRKPFLLNDLILQKALWDRRLCLEILKAAKVPTPYRLVISRDGGPQVDEDLRNKLLEIGVPCNEVPEPKWRMIDDDTLEVDGQIMKKPFVEKPVDGEDHNIYVYYPKKNGGGGRRLFRKIGNKSSVFDPTLNQIRDSGSFIYERFIDTDNFEDVKAYTVGPTYCHVETRKSPVVDGIVRRNTYGKEIRYVTRFSEEEEEMARRVSTYFQQTICGFDLLRTCGKSYVIDVNGFSFVKDNNEYYDKCADILRNMFITAKRRRALESPVGHSEERKQKWVFKGFVSVVRHADRTPKQKFKYSFRSPIFISLLKGYKEEVIIREVRDLKVVLETVRVALEEHLENAKKLEQLGTALEKKMYFPGTKVQLKPALSENGEIEKVQLILKWGGEPTHSVQYQASDLGEQFRQDIQLLNQKALEDVQVFTSSERRVVASAQLFSKSFLSVDRLPDAFLQVRKDLLDDSNAAKDLMDKVKKKLKPLLRQGKEAPPQFAWPPKMPEPFVVIKRVVELMNYHHQIMEKNFATKDINNFQTYWCCGEDPYLFKERWDKLFQEFVSVDKVHPSKISELYDTMKYDALHNREFLQRVFDDEDYRGKETLSHSLVKEYPINVLAMNDFKVKDSVLDPAQNPAGSIGWVLSSSHKPSSREDGNSPFDDPKYDLLRELYRLSKVLFDFICPQEYGIEDNEKLDIGLLTSLPLAKQILRDITGIKETDKAATRIYFTKESHIYTLLNVIYESDIPMKIARNALPELDYLSQIVFELYESEDSGYKKHSIRLSLSPGCHTQDPLDVQLDDRHYISCIRKINLTRHLDMDMVLQKLRSRFSRVSLPKKFTPVNITSPLVGASPSPR